MPPIRVAPVLVIALVLAACGAKDDAAPRRRHQGRRGGGRAAAGRGRRRHRAAPAGRPRHRAARAARGLARRPGARACRRNPAEALVRRGQRRQGGAGAVSIDPATLQSSVASAQATLARAQAGLTQAQAQAERYKPLLEANAISKQDYVNAVAAQKTAEADVAAARANLQTGQINLGYATVTAPISGRIGRALVTEGALVGQGEATPLAVVQQIDPMYVNFTQSTTDVLALRRAVESGKFRRAGGADSAGVTIVLEDGSIYPQQGKLLFSDLSVDPTSGQITLRAEVPNPRGVLLPGMYVRVRLEQAETPTGIVVPQQAVQRGSTGDSVMVVSAEGAVSPRPVKVGSAQGSDWVILDGLKAGEMVMVDGFQKLRGNAPVKPVPWQGAAASAVPAASAASGPLKVSTWRSSSSTGRSSRG